MRIRVKLTLEEIAKGVEKNVKVRRKVQADGVSYKTCTTCNGSGQQMRVTNTILGRMQTATTCGTCSGAGEIISNKPNDADAQGLVTKEETVSINIPAGVTEGVQLKVGGKGNEAPGKNSIAGDLLVLIEEVQHETFGGPQGPLRLRGWWRLSLAHVEGHIERGCRLRDSCPPIACLVGPLSG